MQCLLSIELSLEATDTDRLQTSNVSWSFLSSLLNPDDEKRTYELTVMSTNTPHQTLQLSEPYFVFTAPEGAPPCEIYSFSITAINNTVGVTYTGDGCTQVLSTMLPSLPDISRLEESLSYSLEKQSGKVFLNISFQVYTHFMVHVHRSGLIKPHYPFPVASCGQLIKLYRWRSHFSFPLAIS